MKTDQKRILLSALLKGDLEALQAYRDQQAIEKLNFSHIIDATEVGGPITLVDLQGNTKIITLQELAALPEQARKSSCVRIIDTTGGYKIPAPDDDTDFEELNLS